MMRSKVLLIYTGGTIGMVRNSYTGQLHSIDFQHIDRHVPELQRLDVDISTESIDPPIDSSEICLAHWVQISDLIVRNYVHYDGFVILHGSDTMAYTASAVSFMLQGLGKAVIFTGSQLPIGTIRTDGKENLITAIEIAASRTSKGDAIVQEVAIYFEYSLYRGNRTTKVSANHFEAFKSPNYPPLAVAGVNIDYRKSELFRSNLSELLFSPSFSSDVALLKLYPNIRFSLYTTLFDYSLNRAVVIETYGSGNAPSDKILQTSISNFIEAGGIVLNVTQCYAGSVEQGKYQTSGFFQDVGVVSGSDLTTEAALTKLMYLLGQNLSHTETISLLQTSLVGELTVQKKRN